MLVKPAMPPTFALLVLLIASALGGAGCVIETHHDDASASAAVLASWSFHDMADGAATGCPAGFDTVELVAQPADSAAPIGDPITDLFDCAGGGGLGAAIVPGEYLIWLEVRSHDLQQLYAQSLAQDTTVVRRGQRFAADILNDGGYFQLSWELVGAASGNPIDCSQTGNIEGIAMVSTSTSDAQISYQDRLGCLDHAAVTGGLLAGNYTVSLGAVGGNRALGPTVTLTAQTISDHNQITDLDHVVIPIDGL